MSRELFSVAPGDDVAAAAESILGLGVTASPVLEGSGVAVGMVSLRDLIGGDRGGTVAERMSRPVVSVRNDATVEEAARRLGEANVHRLVVTDADGRAVGIVSAVDLVRALIGLPARHPAALPHLDRETGLSWTDDTIFDTDHVDEAPNAPGLFVLVHGGRDRAEVPVWVEAAPNVRTRLSELLSVPQENEALARLLQTEHAHLRFRAAEVDDRARRTELAETLQARLRRAREPR